MPNVQERKTLYGHPEAGAHWDRHLQEAISQIGGAVVPAHPSSYWVADRRLLLTVYVDDLLLSGPAEQHNTFWKEFRQLISIEDPEPLGRFLGRAHIVT